MRSLWFGVASSLVCLSVFFACSSSDGGGGGGGGSSGDAGGSSSTSSGGSSTSSASSSSGSTSSSSSSASSASSTSSSSSSSSGSSGTCNALTQLGAPVDLFNTQSAPPEPSGGTMVDGTWVQTSGKVWGSTAAEGSKFGTAGAVTMKLTGTAVQTVSTGATSGKVTRESGTFTPATLTTVVFTETCKDPLPDAGLEAPATFGYSASPTTLVLYYSLGGPTLEITYTKQ